MRSLMPVINVVIPKSVHSIVCTKIRFQDIAVKLLQFWSIFCNTMKWRTPVGSLSSTMILCWGISFQIIFVGKLFASVHMQVAIHLWLISVIFKLETYCTLRFSKIGVYENGKCVCFLEGRWLRLTVLEKLFTTCLCLSSDILCLLVVFRIQHTRQRGLLLQFWSGRGGTKKCAVCMHSPWQMCAICACMSEPA